MQDILAYANNYQKWTRSLEYAAEFAAQFDASLTGIYVQEQILPMPALTAPQLLTEIYTIAAEQVEAAQAVESAFTTWATGLGVKRSCWQVAEGPLPDVLAAAGNWYDLLVLGTGSEARWDAVGGIGERLRALVDRDHGSGRSRSACWPRLITGRPRTIDPLQPLANVS